MKTKKLLDFLCPKGQTIIRCKGYSREELEKMFTNPFIWKVKLMFQKMFKN